MLYSFVFPDVFVAKVSHWRFLIVLNFCLMGELGSFEVYLG